MRERGGIVKAMPISSPNKKLLHDCIYAEIEEGTTLYTDEYKSYTDIIGYDHKVINHSVRQYVDGQVSTNGMELNHSGLY